MFLFFLVFGVFLRSLLNVFIPLLNNFDRRTFVHVLEISSILDLMPLILLLRNLWIDMLGVRQRV